MSKEYGIEKDLLHKYKKSLKEIEELKKQNGDLYEIVNAVSHIGVDFGYGEFQLNNDHIEKARALVPSIINPD